MTSNFLNHRLFISVLVTSLMLHFCSAQNVGSNFVFENNNRTEIDSIVSNKIKEHNIPGVAVTLVSKDSVLFSRGYGVKNLATNDSVDSKTTCFDMGSIPKLLTAAAIMKLVELNKLSVDDEINKFLPLSLQFDYKGGEPIRLKNLLTHTAGFEDISNLKIASRDLKGMISLLDFLQEKKPKQVYASGERTIYSNYGYGLLGFIIERVSKKEYASFMAEHFLEPLDMISSGFDNKLPEIIDRALGYRETRNGLEAVPVSYQFNLPAAGLKSSTNDLGNFVSMLLNDGRFKDQIILKPNSVKQIFKVQHLNHSSLQGLGFSARQIKNEALPYWGQNGGWDGFNNDVFLFKDASITFGLIVSVNKEDFSEISEALWNYLLKHYVDEDKLLVNQPGDDYEKFNLSEYDGYYQSNIYSRSKFTKIGHLFGLLPSYQVRSVDDTLFVNSLKFIPVSKDLFRKVDNTYNLAFQRDDKGQIRTMYKGNAHYDSYERKGILFQPLTHIYLILLSFFICLPYIMYLLNRKLSIFLSHKLPPIKGLGYTGIILFFLVSGAAFILLLYGLNIVGENLQFGIDESYMLKISFMLFSALPILYVINLIGLFNGYRGLIREKLFFRILYFSNLAFQLFLIVILFSWNLIGFKY